MSERPNPPHNVLLIFGPPAVGKMTVGQALSEITDFKLLHAHMIIDLVTEFFPYASDAFVRLYTVIQRRIMEEMASAGENLILTFIWNFDDPVNRNQVDAVQDRIHRGGGELFYVELQASLETRVARTRTENRMRNKNTEWATREYLSEWEAQHQTASRGEFPYPERHIALDIETLPPMEAARQIKDRFGF